MVRGRATYADDEWGQRIAMAIVLRPGATPDAAAVQEHVRRALRGSKTPEITCDATEVNVIPASCSSFE